jgi:DNA topoisomerase-1
MVQAIEAVAGVLGNTKSVCRKCYIHPVVLDAYVDRSLVEVLGPCEDTGPVTPEDLRPDEKAVLRFLEFRLRSEQKGAAA